MSIDRARLLAVAACERLVERSTSHFVWSALGRRINSCDYWITTWFEDLRAPRVPGVVQLLISMASTDFLASLVQAGLHDTTCLMSCCAKHSAVPEFQQSKNQPDWLGKTENVLMASLLFLGLQANLSLGMSRLQTPAQTNPPQTVHRSGAAAECWGRSREENSEVCIYCHETHVCARGIWNVRSVRFVMTGSIWLHWLVRNWHRNRAMVWNAGFYFKGYLSPSRHTSRQCGRFPWYIQSRRFLTDNR